MMKIKCSVKSCENLAFINGFCVKHSDSKEVLEYTLRLIDLNKRIRELKDNMPDDFKEQQKVIRTYNSENLAFKQEQKEKEKRLKKEMKEDGIKERGKSKLKIDDFRKRKSIIQRFRQERELFF